MGRLLDSSSYQKELNALVDESIRELDSLFLKLGSQAGADKVGRLLAEVGSRLHSHLEYFELLGADNIFVSSRIRRFSESISGASHMMQYAKAVGKIMMNRVLANAASDSELSFRLLQTIYKSVASHSNSSACSSIKETLSPLKTSLLTQSLAKLFTLVDGVFAQDEKKASLIIEKINVAMKSEMQSVNWDSDLQREMEGNIQKTLKYIAVKVRDI